MLQMKDFQTLKQNPRLPFAEPRKHIFFPVKSIRIARMDVILPTYTENKVCVYSIDYNIVL